jgi:hypothetical protein
MIFVISFLAVTSLAMGLIGLASPATLNSLLATFRGRGGFWAAVVLRLVLGVALWYGASSSRATLVLRALGLLYVVSSVVLFLLGYQRYEALLDWWSRRPTATVRGLSVLAVALGAFLLWSVH